MSLTTNVSASPFVLKYWNHSGSIESELEEMDGVKLTLPEMLK